jgi:hypothetical protein
MTSTAPATKPRVLAAEPAFISGTPTLANAMPATLSASTTMPTTLFTNTSFNPLSDRPGTQSEYKILELFERSSAGDDEINAF